MTELDIAVNTFYNAVGGQNFFATLFAIPVIFAIFYAIIKPFDI